MHTKIKTLDELAGIVAKLKKEGKKIVQCHGVFDLVHPGHIRYFESAARRQNDILIVTITRDEYVNKGPGRPFFSQNLRCESVAALECVDYVALSEGPTAVEAILKLKPDLYVKGSEYKEASGDLTRGISKEAEAARTVGCEVHFTDDITFSSTELLNAYFGVYGDVAEKFLRKFRACYSADQVIENFQKLKPLKALVIGECIIDEYHYCKAIGKPPKEAVIAARYEGEECFAGGVLACANHLAGFLDQVDLVTCLGSQDSREDFVRGSLKSNVRPTFFYRDDSWYRRFDSVPITTVSR